MSDGRKYLSTGEPRVLTWQGPQPLPQIVEKSFSTFVLEEMASVAERGDTIAVVDASTGQKRTYSELCSLVPRVSAGLAAAGVGLGDTVMYFSYNHIDYPVWLLSVMHCGATIALLSPIHEKMQEDALHGIRISGARFAVVHVDLLNSAEAAFSQLPPDTLKKMWVIGDTDRPSAIDELASYDPLPPLTQADGLDPATTVGQISFSSGTTGPRKGVMLSHRNVVSRMIMIKYLAHHGMWHGKNEDYTTCLMMMSMSHLYPQIYIFSTLMFGGTVVILSDFSSKVFVEKIKEYQVTLAIMTPYHIKKIGDAPDIQQGDLRSLKVVTSGGAPLTNSIAEAFKRKVDGQIYNIWGMTEAGSLGTMSLITSDHKDLCIGKLVPFFELKVIDLNSGQMLGEGQAGEIWVRSPTTFLGYKDNPSSTAAVKDKDGWIHTGDYGYYDNQEFIYVTDRIKDLMKTEWHKQVQPSQLENLLMKHPDVAEAAVVGVTNEDLKELPRAFVVLKPDSATEPHMLKKFVDERVQDYKQLKGGVWVVKDIPKNSTGKPMRRMLRDGKVDPLAVC